MRAGGVYTCVYAYTGFFIILFLPPCRLDRSFGGVPLATGREGAARGGACAAGTHPGGQAVLVTHRPGAEGDIWGVSRGGRGWEMHSCLSMLYTYHHLSVVLPIRTLNMVYTDCQLMMCRW